MTTQYTPILQLALPVTGELNGTWGDVVNDNITSMVEEAIAGLATISTWVANSHTLTTADGTTDEARCAMLVATSTTAASEIICPARTKLFVLKNSSSYAVTLKTAAGTGVAVPAGDTAFLFCDGTNVGACVTTIVNGHIAGNLTVDGNTTLGDATSDTITANARFASALNPSADNTYDLGTSGNSWRNLYIDGTATIASLVATTADINGGTIDATSIGATTPSTGVFTQVDITAQGDLRLQDTSGGQYVALQAPGTVPASYTLTMPDTDGDAGQALITDGSGNLSWSTAASGDVYGPASATDNAVARFDGTTGKLIQNSAVTIGDDGATVIAANSTSDGLRITQIGAGNALVVEDSANPDSSPFVINSVGNTLIGQTTAAQFNDFTANCELQVSSLSSRGIQVANFENSFYGTSVIFAKSRGATVGTNTIVQSGDGLGSTYFYGADGTNYIRAASIGAYVDGSPGTNDMPGRLVFSTTADGASSPTERMRIDSAGRVGIGATPSAGRSLTIEKSISGSTAPIAVFNSGVVQSDATGGTTYYGTYAATAAASFTSSSISHYVAQQGTIGAGSTVTNQYGFQVTGSLTGATNNYGFYSNIAVDTGRWNFYANGTAPNHFAGRVGVGTTGTSSGYVTVGAGANQLTLVTTDPTTFGRLDVGHFNNGAFIGTYAGTDTASDLLRFGTNGTERMRIDNAGRVGIGGSAGSDTKFQVAGTAASNSGWSYVVRNTPTIPSTTTSATYLFQTIATTQDAAFSTNAIAHYVVSQGTITGGSRGTVSNQYGFSVESNLTGATNNFGFYSNIALNTGRWNFFAQGTAPNYFAGNALIGSTAVRNVGSPYTVGASKILYMENSGAPAYTPIVAVVNRNDSVGTGIFLGKSRGTTDGSSTIVQSGDELGSLYFAGADGTDLECQAAQIGAYVDGTPGSNDMPGRLVFSTTADGATGPTERMRIDNAGRVGIGGAPFVGANFVIPKTLTGATSSYQLNSDYTVASDVTSSATTFFSYVQTQAAAFTLGNLNHFVASQRAIGAGSTITSQTGFRAENTLTGASNNYGFYSNIAYDTGRWNFFAQGSAQNYFAGNVLIGTTTATDALTVNGNVGLPAATTETRAIEVGKNRAGDGISYIDLIGDTTYSDYGLRFIRSAGASGASQIEHRGTGDFNIRTTEAAPLVFITSGAERMRIDSVGRIILGGGIGFTEAYVSMVGSSPVGGTASKGIYAGFTIPSGATGGYYGSFDSYPNTAAAAFTLPALYHFRANQGTIGAGSIVTNQYGFTAQGSLTGAANNFGFRSEIAYSAGRWNFYASGTAANYFAGSLGIGDTGVTGYNLLVSKNITGATTSFGIGNFGAVQSDVTTEARYLGITTSTAAAAFTLPALSAIAIYQGTFGAGSTVTNQYGVYVGANLTGATNNYGFYSNIAYNTGRWNFYAAGTADNYFAGNVGIGTFVSGGNTKVQVAGDITLSALYAITSNLYFSGGWKYAANGFGGIVNPSDSNGNFVISRAANNSSGAGSAATLTTSMIIDSSGNVIQSAPTTAPTLSTNGTMVFNLTSNTNLRVSVRGSDGVTRTANITLA